MTLRNSVSSAASHRNPNEGTSFEQKFAFFALAMKASRRSLSPLITILRLELDDLFLYAGCY